jgi:2-hydroxy-6-oxonona-2,4-dienedioate hydrolase
MTNLDVKLPVGELVPAGEHQIFVMDIGQGAPTIFLHGGGPGCSGWTDFGPVVPYFEGRRLILVDLLQYGQSSKVGCYEPLWAWHARHIVAMMDAKGIAQADFVCSSVGGSAALALAANYPDRVRKVVLTGSAPMKRGAEPASAELGLAGRSAWENYFADEGPTWEKCRHIMAQLEWFDETKIPDSTVDLRFRQSIDPGILALGPTREHRGLPEDLEEDLKKVVAPVLFMWARHDPFVVPAYAQLLADTVVNGDVYVMAHVSHHLEEERPADYSGIVRGFLDRSES